MVLDGEQRQFPVPEPFNGAVIQADVRGLQPRRQGIGPDGKTVVLGCYVNPPGAEVFDRVVGAPMAELKLERVGSQCTGGYLVSRQIPIMGTRPSSLRTLSTR